MSEGIHIKLSPKARRLYLRYLMVGGAAYIVEMGALYLFRHELKLSPLKSVAISFWAGFIVAFILQKIFTFKNYDRRPKIITRQVIQYSLLVAWNYGFSLLAVKIFQKNLSVFVIRTLCIAIIVLWNFYIYNNRIFKTNESTE